MDDIITIVATEHDGLDVRVLVINARIIDGDPRTFDLKGAVRKAVHEFLCTKGGKEIYDCNCGGFNWADFEPYVPNEICRKYGFEKLDSAVSDLEVDWDEHLADDEALEKFWDNKDEDKEN